MRLFLILFFLPIISSAQIQIDKAGDFWEIRVDSALKKIKNIDSCYYSQVIGVCDKISFWNNNFSSCEGEAGRKDTILISVTDIKYGDVNDVAAVIVHESQHLKFLKLGVTFGNPNDEEVLCYQYELEFLKKVPGVSKSLIRHAEIQIKRFYHR